MRPTTNRFDGVMMIRWRRAGERREHGVRYFVMTERKPTGLSWESWIDRQIQEGREQGAFDDLSGSGRPFDDIGVVHDEMWWVKAKLRDEDISYLPPTIAIRTERAAAIDAAMLAETEATARLLIDDVNQQIRYVNSHATAGPPSSVMTVDVETFIERWRVAHPGHDAPVGLPDARTEPDSPVHRRRWRQRWRAWFVGH